MNAKTFKVIDGINREGLDNSQWGMCHDVESTKLYFGSDEDIELRGQFVYVYRDENESYSFLSSVKADHTLNISSYKCVVDIYRL